MRGLAQRILRQQDAVTALNEQGELQGEFELLPIQRWYRELAPNRSASSTRLFWCGYRDVRRTVADLVAALADQHDMLRAF